MGFGAAGPGAGLVDPVTLSSTFISMQNMVAIYLLCGDIMSQKVGAPEREFCNTDWVEKQ